MKEATGELSMTVVTIIAIVVIAGIVAFLRKPIQNFISATFFNTTQQEINDANTFKN